MLLCARRNSSSGPAGVHTSMNVETWGPCNHAAQLHQGMLLPSSPNSFAPLYFLCFTIIHMHTRTDIYTKKS